MKRGETIVIANSEIGVPAIFKSIQGEGPGIGRPSVFVRLAGCNLTCLWCDTPETWNYTELNPSGHKDAKTFDRSAWATVMTIDEAVLNVESFGPIGNVVITGGEPMIQQTSVIELIKGLNRDGYNSFEIETNGTITPSREFFDLPVDLAFNVSPKLNSSGNSTNRSLRLTALQTYASLRLVKSPTARFKFVICDPEKDVQDLEKIADELSMDRSSVFLMPEGRTEEELRMKAKDLVQLCIDKGFRYCPRLHIELYGNRRGV